jgi:pyridoxamine 5'-phosphate oxidase
VGIADDHSDYESPTLDVARLAPEPVAQWWRWYDAATAASCTDPNAMVVATVDAEGRPDARLVLARGFDERGVVFYTNTLSAKGRQLAHRPSASCVFGWLELHRQVRVRGPVTVVGDDEADAYWASRPRASQLGAWASPQSTVLGGRVELDLRLTEVEHRYAAGDVPRPPHWTGYRVGLHEVEFWQGRRSRLHDRLRYRWQDDGWLIERLAP